MSLSLQRFTHSRSGTQMSRSNLPKKSPPCYPSSPTLEFIVASSNNMHKYITDPRSYSMYGLIVVSARTVSNHHQDRALCIQDEQFERAVEIFTSHSDTLHPCGPNPLRSPSQLNHKYPRFKAIGWATFWLLVPGRYCHLVVEPENIEFSKGSSPLP